MTPQVSAFRWVPDFAQGFVRDLRVRWALEEAELPYEAVLIDHDIKATPGYRAWQPFGQVPAYRDQDVEMFESGAIVLHLAARSEALAPRDPAGQARVACWVLAALNSVEPVVQQLAELDVFHAGEGWIEERRPQLERQVELRLSQLATWLGDRHFLEGRFTAGDLMMTTVLRELAGTPLLARHPTIDALRERCESRPAFKRALDAQLAPFRKEAAA
ncbi:MAG: glutathione S-transferase family protein [Geminicoccaceae bacterium]